MLCGMENPGPLHRAAWLGIARVALKLRAAAVMGAGSCCWADLGLACIEKWRLPEAENPYYKESHT